MSLHPVEAALGLERPGSDPAVFHFDVTRTLLFARGCPGDRDHRLVSVRIRYERDQAPVGPTVVPQPRSGRPVGGVWCEHPEKGVAWENSDWVGRPRRWAESPC